jgi:hypothetical protein
VSSVISSIVEDSKVADIVTNQTTGDSTTLTPQTPTTSSSSNYNNYYDNNNNNNPKPSLSATANKITVGGEEIRVKNGFFISEYNNSKNITDYFDINLSKAYTIKQKNISSIDDLNITIKVTEKGVDKSATLKVINAKVKIDSNNKIEQTIFEKGNTKILVSPHNLEKLQTELNVSKDGVVDATVKNTIQNEDLSFNIKDGVLDNLAGDKTNKIKGAIDTLNEYFHQGKSYAITISIESPSVELSGDKIIGGVLLNKEFYGILPSVPELNGSKPIILTPPDIPDITKY